MSISVTSLRADIYKTFERIAETDEPVLVHHKGALYRITKEREGFNPDAIVTRPNAIVGDPDELVSVDFADAWPPGEL